MCGTSEVRIRSSPASKRSRPAAALRDDDLEDGSGSSSSSSSSEVSTSRKRQSLHFAHISDDGIADAFGSARKRFLTQTCQRTDPTPT